jgi:hypothetical protein
MIWTTNKPKVTGHYWAVYKDNDHHQVEIVLVLAAGIVMRTGWGNAWSLDDFRCWSDYPIHQPQMMAPPLNKGCTITL